MKGQPSEWEKIIANEATDKGLISKIYKQHIQLNIRKTNSPIKKMSRIFQYVFLKITHADGQKHMNRCLIALITKKMQI